MYREEWTRIVAVRGFNFALTTTLSAKAERHLKPAQVMNNIFKSDFNIYVWFLSLFVKSLTKSSKFPDRAAIFKIG